MNRPKKNILLTGVPSSGKTTVIRKVIQLLDRPATGFYTEEERVAGRRVGFMMNTLDGRQCHLARRDMKSNFHVKDYGVSVENIEEVAVPSIAPRNSNIIVIDEIGRMECFSGLFNKAVTRALDSRNVVVGTITLGDDAFIREIKERGDVEIHRVTADNRDSLPELILRRVTELLEEGSSDMFGD